MSGGHASTLGSLRTAAVGSACRKTRGFARERKRGWQRGHQNRLRPLSSAVRTLDPQTRHGWAGAPVHVHLPAVVVAASAHDPSPPRCARAARCRSGPSPRPRRAGRPGRPTPPATGHDAGCDRHAADRSGAGRAPRRGRRCPPRPAPAGPSAGSPIARSLAWIRRQARSGSASSRRGSGPSEPITASRLARATRLHRIAPRRSAYAVFVLQPQPHGPDRRRGRDRAPRPTYRSIRGARARSGHPRAPRTRASHPTPPRSPRPRRARPACAANRPCGLLTRTARPAKASSSAAARR